jgi:hypothetical protein
VQQLHRRVCLSAWLQLLDTRGPDVRRRSVFCKRRCELQSLQRRLCVSFRLDVVRTSIRDLCSRQVFAGRRRDVQRLFGRLRVPRRIHECVAAGIDMPRGYIRDCRVDDVRQLQCWLCVSSRVDGEQPRDVHLCRWALLTRGRHDVPPLSPGLCVSLCRLRQLDGGHVHDRFVLDRCRGRVPELHGTSRVFLWCRVHFVCRCRMQRWPLLVGRLVAVHSMQSWPVQRCPRARLAVHVAVCSRLRVPGRVHVPNAVIEHLRGRILQPSGRRVVQLLRGGIVRRCRWDDVIHVQWTLPSRSLLRCWVVDLQQLLCGAWFRLWQWGGVRGWVGVWCWPLWRRRLDAVSALSRRLRV